MSCHAYHDLLQERLDGTATNEPAELTEHLRGCADCRALEAATRRLREGLSLLAAPAPPPDLAARIADRVVLDRRRARRKARQRWAVTLALAAGLFIALLLRIDWHGRPDATDTGKSTPAVTKTAPTQPAAPTLRESVAEAGEAVAALTSQTASETVAPTRWLLPNVSRPALPAMELPPIEPATRPLREAGAGVSVGLEPVTSSARRAVDLFLRELPPMETGQNGL